MTRKNVLLFLLGLVCTTISIWQTFTAQNDLEVITLHSTVLPVTIITPSGSSPASRPTVLIAHGFAGSSVLMRGFALTLAHAGYTTVSWDFTGHGMNPHRMQSSSDTDHLLQDAESALAETETTGLIDTEHIAILGHSMGSGVALAYGIAHPYTSATVAISPIQQSVTSELPHNLLLMAGSLEPQFINNAENLLSLAGGQSTDFLSGSARQLTIIPDVEHISILFSPTAHLTARSWLDDTFGIQPGSSAYTDRRGVWFGLGILGFIFLANAGLRLISSPDQPLTRKHFLRRLVAVLAGGITSTIILWLVSLSGVQTNRIFGVLVGGYLILWFGLAGVIILVALRPQISLPKAKEVLRGLVAFAALWLGVGLLGNNVWLPWLLVPARLWLWIPGSIIIFPWFLAIAEVARQAKFPGQIGWWLFQSLTVILSLYLATMLNPSLGFIFIILPLVPVMIGIHTLVISPRYGSWAYGISGAMFIAWLLLAVFPLQ